MGTLYTQTVGHVFLYSQRRFGNSVAMGTVGYTIGVFATDPPDDAMDLLVIVDEKCGQVFVGFESCSIGSVEASNGLGGLDELMDRWTPSTTYEPELREGGWRRRVAFFSRMEVV